MLEAGGDIVYVNEPMNPRRPPGRSPGVLNARVTHRFHYVDPTDDARFERAFRDTLRLRYRPLAELGAVRRPYDVGRMMKYCTSFTIGRVRGRSALLDDPYALMSAQWLAEKLSVKAVVLVRDPVALLGSWRKLGWRIDLSDLLGQPALVRDHLGQHVELLERAQRSGSWTQQMCGLWCVAHDLVDEFRKQTPRIVAWRYEDLASHPSEQFSQLYEWFGLEFTGRARQRIEQATSSDHGEQAGFSWSFRGGASRTAFQPMDSRRAVAAQQHRLDADEIRTVRSLTGEMLARFPRVTE